jgi:hypothetical protein
VGIRGDEGRHAVVERVVDEAPIATAEWPEAALGIYSVDSIVVWAIVCVGGYRLVK